MQQTEYGKYLRQDVDGDARKPMDRMSHEYIDISRHHPRVKLITLAMLTIDLLLIISMSALIAF